MDKKKQTGSISGKGYYIALVLCSVAIAIVGFLYYRNGKTPSETLQDPTANAGKPTSSDVQAVATQPAEPGGTVALPKKPAKIVSPLEGQTIAPYAMDTLCYNETTRDWRVHDGIDIAAKAGTPVCAAASGTVYTVYADETMGMTVVLQHEGGYFTRYASLEEKVPVQAGDTVAAGEQIGTVGATALLESGLGDHLHFSVSCNNTALNPAEFLGTK